MRWKQIARAATAAAGATTAMSLAQTAHANVTVSPLISDGMVLQQQTKVRIWGHATPGESVTVGIAGETEKTTADRNGDWEVMLSPLKPGGPFTLTITGLNTLTIKDVLVGEVWVCSGQSNMELPLVALGTPEGQADIKTANDPQLRMFTVSKRISSSPQAELAGGKWLKAQPDQVGGFSAVGYYFARSLRRELKVPIGMIHTSWGGTRIEAWTQKETLLKQGIAPSEFALDQNSDEFKAMRAAYDARVAAWTAAGAPTGMFADSGIAPTASGWQSADLSDDTWKVAKLPGDWDTLDIPELQHVDGGVWFRRTIDVSADDAALPATLSLGAIDDADITYVNGVKVGGVGPETPMSWQIQRRYQVPAGTLKPGKNVIAVRVWDYQGGGGLTGPATSMTLTPSGKGPLSLSGDWKFKIENVRPSDPGNPPGLDNPNAASVLFNAMLNPLTRYTIKGALWYQGESNAGNPTAYRTQLPDMIKNWRELWDVGDFPFYVVQLAPFGAIRPEPTDSGWAGLREAQSLAQSAIPNVGTAIITDVGEVEDIHPRRKAPVGDRLALLARTMTYGQRVEGHSPEFKFFKTEGANAIVTFDHVGGGLVAAATDSHRQQVTGAATGRVVGFTIAGADGKYYNADATVTGKNTVRVSAPQVPEPKSVRFGWADFPIVNLMSKDGLPAAPFRSDKP